MSGSYTLINYGLRPAKHIERKMLCESFRRLSEFGALESYRYVGFGSIYFTDFVLLHKSLGITNLHSIEKDAYNEKRFKFNSPFKAIELHLGESNAELPKLNWNVRSIVWLDNDDPLDSKILTDVAFITANCLQGSLLVVSIQAQPERFDTGPLEILRERIGAERLPADLSAESLRGWGTAAAYRRIITNQIEEILTRRNGSLPKGSRICYKQVFNFHYADNAKMLTIGGIFYDEGQSAILAKCNFNNLHFVREGESPFHIEAPLLTMREIRHLDKQLPNENAAELSADGVPPSDIEKYSRFYRHFPTFGEVEM
jgi:putative O-methyltransferase